MPAFLNDKSMLCNYGATLEYEKGLPLKRAFGDQFIRILFERNREVYGYEKVLAKFKVPYNLLPDGEESKGDDFQSFCIVTVYASGLHRFVKLDFAENIPTVFNNGVTSILQENYNFLGNNCITSVKKILSLLHTELGLFFDDLKAPYLPASFDSKIKKLIQEIAADTDKFSGFGLEENVPAEMAEYYRTYSIMGNGFARLFTPNKESSLGPYADFFDLIVHIHGKHLNKTVTGYCSGDRTFKTLVQLGWLSPIRNNKPDMFLLGDNAPEEFARILQLYYLKRQDNESNFGRAALDECEQAIISQGNTVGTAYNTMLVCPTEKQQDTTGGAVRPRQGSESPRSITYTLARAGLASNGKGKTFELQPVVSDPFQAQLTT